MKQSTINNSEAHTVTITPALSTPAIPHPTMTRTTTPSRIEPTLPPPPPQNARPGRAYSHAIEIDMESHYGKSHTQKSDTDIRIFFQNVKGLTYSASGED